MEDRRMADKIQIRRDTAANWTSADPTLAQGELGLETDTGQLKAGTGTTAWTSLGYYNLGALTDPAYTGTPVEDIYAMSGTSVALEPSNGSDAYTDRCHDIHRRLLCWSGYHPDD